MLPEMLVKLRLRSPHKPPRHTYEEMFAESGLRVWRHALAETRRRGQCYLSLAHLLDALAAEEAAAFEALVGHTGSSARQVRDYLGEAVEAYPPQTQRGIRIAPEVEAYLRKVKEVACAEGRRIEAADYFAVLARGTLGFPRRVEWGVKTA